MTGEHCIDLARFRVTAVRHMAWMCCAPQLIRGSSVFDLAAEVPEGVLDQLRGWDAEPESGPPLLTEPAHPRLGFYFERLYQCLLVDVMGWELLAKNLQVKNTQRTLGELDFLFRNPHSGDVEHHEIAVKFYLGFPSPETGEPLWYGPNAKDRLDLKTRRLREHQSQLTHRPEALAALKRLGIEQPLATRIYMPGYLYYPFAEEYPAPLNVPEAHLRGYWMYLADALKVTRDHWVPLRKPHWLGPWRQSEAPEVADTRAALEEVQLSETPRLFAALTWDDNNQAWTETRRLFVVPARWPR